MRNLTISVCSLICLLMVVLLFGCGGGNSSTSTGSTGLRQTGGAGQYGTLQFSVSTDKASYSIGEPVTITFSVTNTGTQTVQTTHTGIVYITSVFQGDQAIWSVPQATGGD